MSSGARPGGMSMKPGFNRLAGLLAVLLCMTAGMWAQTAMAQKPERFEAVAKQLNLTPEQKAQLIPILRAEAPKLEAIKSNTSLTRAQKMEQLRAVHAETAPQVKGILTADQYRTLQEIRRQEIMQAMQNRRTQ